MLSGQKRGLFSQLATAIAYFAIDLILAPCNSFDKNQKVEMDWFPLVCLIVVEDHGNGDVDCRPEVRSGEDHPAPSSTERSEHH